MINFNLFFEYNELSNVSQKVNSDKNVILEQFLTEYYSNPNKIYDDFFE
jgi:hypothetical protein